MQTDALTLLVMRHAKSDWSSPQGGDHERPLNKRGVAAAKRMGAALSAGLAKSLGAPERILASTAVRARTTAELVAAAGDFACPFETHRDLYESSPGHVLRVLAEHAGDARIVLVCGHEPTSSQLVSQLIGGARLRFPTAAVACLRSHAGTWSELAHAGAELRCLWTPRLLGLPAD